jgi:hypothetical protein
VTLAEGERDAGVWETAWDGRAEGGRRAEAGVYFARLRGEGFAGTVKFLVQ